MRRSLPLWLGAEELAHTLLKTLGGSLRHTEREDHLAHRLREDPKSLGPVIHELLDQPENMLRLLARHVVLRSGVDLNRVDMVSLGSHCFTASLLRRWGLRHWSGPFDWLFSSVPMVTHCLTDDFKTFLDRSQYDPIPPEKRPHGLQLNRVNHRHYLNEFGIEYVFNHHDAHLDADYTRFVRAVQRLRATLTGPRFPVLVVTRMQVGPALDDVAPLRDILAARSPRFLLLVYEIPYMSSGGERSPSLSLLHSEPCCQVMEFRPRSPWAPLSFEDPVDEHIVVSDLLTRVAKAEMM